MLFLSDCSNEGLSCLNGQLRSFNRPKLLLLLGLRLGSYKYMLITFRNIAFGYM
jgi:hypothetical protein